MRYEEPQNMYSELVCIFHSSYVLVLARSWSDLYSWLPFLSDFENLQFNKDKILISLPRVKIKFTSFDGVVKVTQSRDIWYAEFIEVPVSCFMWLLLFEKREDGVKISYQ
jgi:hypothetical protein